jgi:hypothetical protein
VNCPKTGFFVGEDDGGRIGISSPNIDWILLMIAPFWEIILEYYRKNKSFPLFFIMTNYKCKYFLYVKRQVFVNSLFKSHCLDERGR